MVKVGVKMKCMHIISNFYGSNKVVCNFKINIYVNNFLVVSILKLVPG